MLGPPVDSFPVWVGLALVSVAFLGLAVRTPTAPTPDAVGVADTVDAVAASRPPTRATHPVTATAVEIGPRRVALRGDGGTAHATFAYGPVAPVRDGTPLDAVLRGDPPSRAFRTGEAFERAVGRARNRPPAWRPVGDHVRVRHVEWEGVDVTLVGA